jgi:hypothetical protein
MKVHFLFNCKDSSSEEWMREGTQLSVGQRLGYLLCSEGKTAVNLPLRLHYLPSSNKRLDGTRLLAADVGLSRHWVMRSSQ